jgi:hypothetical protein
MKIAALSVLRLALLPMFVCAALAASAQQAAPLPAYDVELIVFQHLTASATPEAWELEAAAADERFAIPDEEPTPFSPAAPETLPQPEAFAPLPASRFKLTAIEETLRRSRHYRPLAHIAWTQPGYARNEARYRPIDGVVPSSSGIKGQVALTRGRYLHLTLDLTFEPPDEPGQRYSLRQTRRMRSNERHYIDHPKFGVIAVITPVANE